MSTIAYAIVCAVKLVNLFARRQHLIDTAATPIDVDSNFFLSYPLPCPCFNFTQNVTI